MGLPSNKSGGRFLVFPLLRLLFMFSFSMALLSLIGVWGVPNKTLIHSVVERRNAPILSTVTHVRSLLTSFLFLDHRYDLFVRKSCLQLSVLLLGGLYTNLEEF
ncbi:MAG: hypothetical protein ACJAYH_002390 [Celeribacter sp.]